MINFVYKKASHKKGLANESERVQINQLRNKQRFQKSYFGKQQLKTKQKK